MLFFARLSAAVALLAAVIAVGVSGAQAQSYYNQLCVR
jgi:hypothetical protein